MHLNKFSLSCFTLLYAFNGYTAHSSDLHEDVISEIATHFKSSISAREAENPGSIRHMMMGHFRKFRLLENDRWRSPVLERIGADLLPEVNLERTYTFIDEVSACARQNPYLLDALEKMRGLDLGTFNEKVRQDGPEIFPDVVAYAMVLDNLTKAIQRDVNILQVADDIWDQTKERISIRKTLGNLAFVKYWGLHHMGFYKKPIRSNMIDPNFCRFFLPLNIFEASAVDFIRGNFKNAYAGLVLARHRPGGAPNPLTGSGPASVETDELGRRNIHLRCPFSRQWADFYTTWNLGFVSTLSSFPYIMAKLLIPSVNSYEQSPESYISRRSIALYLQLNFTLFHRLDNSLTPAMTMWPYKLITKAFGKANLENAKRYQQQVSQVEQKPTIIQRFNNFITLGFTGFSRFVRRMI